jgi:hypothetical protein
MFRLVDGVPVCGVSITLSTRPALRLVPARALSVKISCWFDFAAFAVAALDQLQFDVDVVLHELVERIVCTTSAVTRRTAEYAVFDDVRHGVICPLDRDSRSVYTAVDASAIDHLRCAVIAHALLHHKQLVDALDGEVGTVVSDVVGGPTPAVGGAAAEDYVASPSSLTVGAPASATAVRAPVAGVTGLGFFGHDE